MASYFEWRFVVEEETSPDIWRSTSSHDNVEQAVQAAKDSTRKARVRQFKTTFFTEEPEAEQPASDFFEKLDTTKWETNVPLVSFFCPAHPDSKVKALETSLPRCPTCHQEMFQGDGTVQEAK